MRWTVLLGGMGILIGGAMRAAVPDLGIVPSPQRVELRPGRFSLDDRAPVYVDGQDAAALFAAEALVEELRDELGIAPAVADINRTVRESMKIKRQDDRKEAVVTLGLSKGSSIHLGVPTKNVAVASRLREFGLSMESVKRPEGYILAIDEKGILIAADSDRGLLYGAMSLAQLAIRHRGKLPCVRVVDWPAMSIRGVHDENSYGQVSTTADFKKIIRFLSRHKMNSYILYIEDLYRFDSHPTIGIGRGAFTRAQIDELEAYAKPRGVDIIPVFETLGNQGALLMLDEVRPLAEFPGAHSFAVAEPTYRFLAECLDELTKTFDSPYFHAGLDESWDLGFGKTKERVQREGRAEIHAEHYRRVNEMIKARGKKMMMYADIILNRPKILQLIPKDIILMDWHYEPDHHFPSVDKLRDAGFPLIVLSGLNNWDRIFPDTSAAAINIRQFTLDAHRRQALGAMVSTWGDNGSKNLRELNFPGYAYQAQMAWNPEDSDVRAFHQRYFQLRHHADASGALAAIHACLEHWPWWFPLLDYFREPFLPRKDNRQYREQDLFRVRENAQTARALIAETRPKLRRQQADLDYLDYCARMHLHYVDGQSLVRDLREADARKLAGDERARRATTLLARATAIREEGERLREVFRELWLRTNVEANLQYCLADYDRLIHSWREAERRLEKGAFDHDPRPPASWIYHPAGFDERKKIPHAGFRKKFSIKRKDLVHAAIQLHGDTHVIVSINGHRLGEQFARRNLSAPVNPLLLRLYDLTSLLEEGENVLSVEARVYGSENRNLEPGGPVGCAGFHLFGEVTLKNDQKIRLSSNPSWRVSETLPEGWTNVGFDDSSWSAAQADPHPTIWVTYPDFQRTMTGYSSAR